MTTKIEKGPTGRIKRLREVLAGMTTEDVLGVLQMFSLEDARGFGFGESTDFDLVFEGQAFPPKAILGLAARREVGRPLTADEFSGGEASACFAILRALGFSIQPKAAGARGAALSGLHRLQAYDRAGIAGLFEPAYEFKRGSGRWGISGIVETPKDSGNFVLIVTLGAPVEGNPYQDALTLDGHLLWESQTQQDLDSSAIRKLLAHDSDANNVHLFLRAKEGAKYTYFGLLNYFSHDPNRVNPVHVIWTVQNWDLGEADLKLLGIPCRAPLDPAYSSTPPLAIASDLSRVPPPTAPAPAASAQTPNGQGRKRKTGSVDWAARDERNRHLGLQGEKLVLQYEVATLTAAGRADLAAAVQHIALVDSAAGFDIASFQPDGRSKRIEVKTTQGPASTPFYISLNEVRASRDAADSFSIYRVFDLRPDSQSVSFFELPGDVELSCGLVPVSFRATPVAIKDD